MTKNMFKRGFTLIELLVVIAIIGILASVVLASLNSARAKGADSAVKSNLANARAEAEIFYDSQTPVGYNGVCATTGTNVIGDNVAAAAAATGATYTASDAGNAGAALAVCHDSDAGWAILAPLSDDTGWCSDSTGVAIATAITALDADDDITCQ